MRGATTWDEKESEALLIPRPQAQSSITPPWQFLSVCLYASLLSLSLFLSFLRSFYVSPMDASRSNPSPTLVQLQTSSSQRALAMKRRDKTQNRSELGRRREDVRRGDFTRTTLHDTIRAYNRRWIVVSISSYKKHIRLLQDRSR
jgi:hypothetical protein